MRYRKRFHKSAKAKRKGKRIKHYYVSRGGERM